MNNKCGLILIFLIFLIISNVKADCTLNGVCDLVNEDETCGDCSDFYKIDINTINNSEGLENVVEISDGILIQKGDRTLVYDINGTYVGYGNPGSGPKLTGKLDNGKYVYTQISSGKVIISVFSEDFVYESHYEYNPGYTCSSLDARMVGDYVYLLINRNWDYTYIAKLKYDGSVISYNNMIFNDSTPGQEYLPSGDLGLFAGENNIYVFGRTNAIAYEEGGEYYASYNLGFVSKVSYTGSLTWTEFIEVDRLVGEEVVEYLNITDIKEEGTGTIISGIGTDASISGAVKWFGYFARVDSDGGIITSTRNDGEYYYAVSKIVDDYYVVGANYDGDDNTLIRVIGEEESIYNPGKIYYLVGDIGFGIIDIAVGYDPVVSFKILTTPAASCGDSECNGTETCETCEADCGACPVDEYCGDNICNADETCSNCSHDCGSCGSPNPPDDPIDEEEITYGYFRSYPFQISNLQEYLLGLELSTTKNHTEKFRVDVLDSNNKLIYSKEFSKYLGKEASVDLKIKLGNKSYEPGLGTLRLVEVDTDEVLDQEIVYLIIEAEDYALYVTRSGQEQIDSSIKEGTITFNEIISIHNYGPGKAEDVEIPVSVFFETLSAYIKSDGKSIEINKEENIISFILEELAPNKDKTYNLTTEEKGIKQEKKVELEGEYFDSNNNECKVYEVTLTNTSEAREVNSNYEWGYYSITEVHVGSMTGDQIEVENEKSVYGFDVKMGPKRTIKVYVYQPVNQEFSSGFNQFFKDLGETIKGIMSSVVFKSASYLAFITAAIIGGYLIYKKFFKVKGKKKVR